ncbi:MAG: NAD(P)H:quinone oxidoreductase [Solirubrobacteraceae bacterium]|nr:NAD(P)H:quinone oxidoreductase [Solirubrobacteraceae bacterium]
MAKIAVIYYSATGTVHKIAEQIAKGAEDAGAEVRFRRVPELAPAEAIASNEGWQQHVTEVNPHVQEATIDDLDWADGFAIGSPTRFGLPTSQLKQFLDTTGGLWAEGKLVGKLATAFTSASTAHGGLESTVLAISNTFYHWGALILPPGYSTPELYAAGTPYGITQHTGDLTEGTTAAANAQGKRLAEYAAKLAGAPVSA